MVQFPEPPREDYASVYLEDTDRPLPGKVDVGLRYAYFKTIARGGKSIIQVCKDLQLSRTICYKSLREELADDPIEQQRLLREARVTAMLQHPNTIPTYELGRDRSGHYYFTMKYVHGYTLRELIDRPERHELSKLVEVLAQIGQALEYAHTHGVAHRDLKPANILIGPFGEVLLLDWGMAKVWHPDGTPARSTLPDATLDEEEDLSLTGQSRLQGTVAYMSPEQIKMDPRIDYRTDTFSLGAILYEILSGHTPSEGLTVDEIVHKTLKVEPPKPSTLTELEVPELLEQLCMRCLAKDPDARPAHMREVLEELQAD